MPIQFPQILSIPAALLIASVQARAVVVPHALLTSHAVLQRDAEVPVWGTADEGEKVTVSFAGQSVSTTARDGKWMLRLNPMKASAEPRTLTISGNNKVTFDDVLVGEVWICGGQSNMAWPMARSASGPAVAAKIDAPQIRLFKVPTTQSGEPQESVNASWTPCDPKNALEFSAVAYYFGRDLQKALNVPVGLIGSHVGGTTADKWISEKSLLAHPGLKDLIARQKQAEAAYDPEKARIAFEAAKAKHAQSIAAGGKPSKPPTLAGNPKGRGPASLYNGMIAPLQPFAFRGVIWYQGESNRGNPPQYAKLFPTLIADWRAAWNQPDFPFLFVQLPPFNAIPPELREIQFNVWKKTSNTGMVVITDHATPNDIHPPVKEPVGQRLALAARAIAYKEPITWSGPVYKSMNSAGEKAVIHFTSTGTGLKPEAALKGFTIAGADGKFVPADASVRGNTVEVSSPSVRQPVAVRYGWANAPEVNLFNQEGLPAVPFRTDSPTEKN